MDVDWIQGPAVDSSEHSNELSYSSWPTISFLEGTLLHEASKYCNTVYYATEHGNNIQLFYTHLAAEEDFYCQK